MIGLKIYKPINKSVYITASDWCNNTRKGIIVDRGDYYEVVKRPELTIEEKLEMERSQLQSWMTEHAYVGINIAIGIATKEEYSDLISQMKDNLSRIREIDDILKQGDTK